MSDIKTGIGAIKLFDRVNKRGVISQQDVMTKQNLPLDIYFEVSDDKEALSLHEGQLVQFDIVDEKGIGTVGRNIKILSKMA